MRYIKGQVVTVLYTFKVSGTPTDPTTVTFKVKDPSGNIESFIYGFDPEVVRTSEGVYTMDIDTDEHGDWYYRVEGDGAVIDAFERKFTVDRSQF